MRDRSCDQPTTKLLEQQGLRNGRPPGKTVAETSGFEATSRHQDVMAFVAALQRQSKNVRVETLAYTAEGKRVPLLVLGDPAPASPADLANDDRAVVYFQANIHAGEVEGKEAALMLARDVLQGRWDGRAPQNVCGTHSWRPWG